MCYYKLFSLLECLPLMCEQVVEEVVCFSEKDFSITSNPWLKGGRKEDIKAKYLSMCVWP